MSFFKKISILFFSFFWLPGTAQVTLIKGPYLQIGTPTSINICWETSIPCDSKVQYGTNANSLTLAVTNSSNILSHQAQLTGLLPHTKYFYSVGTTTLVIQGDTNNYFITSPAPGVAGKYRFWVTGDCGNASVNQTNVRNQFMSYNGNRPVNGWLLLGDNAYYFGSDSEYNAEFFAYYQNNVMKSAVLWPTPGNHDYINGTSTSTNIPYYSIFSTPDNAQAGGIASGTEAYYSFDYGNIHFISLDSYGTTGANQKMYDTLSPQALWLKQDLAANHKLWTIAYWHHPPYTMGSHNSDTESDLVSIRQDFIRILERYNVDLIMCGHSHDYERSRLLHGHYGPEATFSATTHLIDSSSAMYNGTTNSCPYIKDTVNHKSGTVYVVSGSSGQLGGQQTSFPHDAMFYSDATNGGSMILDVENNRLDLKWLCADGVIRDQFTMFKNVNHVTSYTVHPGQNVNLTPSWPGNYNWSNSATLSPQTVNTFSNNTFWVKDNYNCVADTFHFKVLPAASFSNSGIYCAGQALQFNDFSSNNPTYWAWTVTPSAGVNINNSTTQNPLIYFSAPTVYSVTLVSGNAFGPGTAYVQTLVINPVPPVLYNTPGATVCAGESTTLSATGSPGYSWSSGSNTFSASVSPLINTVYTTTFTNTYGCSNTGSVQVIVNACLGNDELAVKKLSLYNRDNCLGFSSDALSTGSVQVILFDTSGKCVYSEYLHESNQRMCPGLEPGFYYYRLCVRGTCLAKGKLMW